MIKTPLFLSLRVSLGRVTPTKGIWLSSKNQEVYEAATVCITDSTVEFSTLRGGELMLS